MRSLNFLNSIDNNQNIAWDKGAYSLIIEMFSYSIASDEVETSWFSLVLL